MASAMATAGASTDPLTTRALMGDALGSSSGFFRRLLIAQVLLADYAA